MNFKKYFLIAIFAVLSQNTFAQIKNLDEFIIKTEEMRMLTQRLAKDYIMIGVLPNNQKVKKEMTDDMTKFNDILINLTEDAPNDEIEIELQKLSLSLMLINKILDKPYDRLAASKVIKYADKMEKEVSGIGDIVTKSTNQKSVRLLRISSRGRMLSQKMLLYYIANRVKIKNKDIQVRFEETKQNLHEVIKVLIDQSNNDPDLKADEGIIMYVNMIKDGFDNVRKNINLKAKVHPLTANMILNQLTENFNLLTDIFYTKFNG